MTVGRVRLTSPREGVQGVWARLVGLQMDGGCLASLWCSLRFRMLCGLACLSVGCGFVGLRDRVVMQGLKNVQLDDMFSVVG